MRRAFFLPLLISLLLLLPSAAQGAPEPPAPPVAGSLPPLPGFPAPYPILPAEIRQGDALIVWVPAPTTASEYLGDAVLRSPAGAELQRARPFLVPSPSGPCRAAYVFGVAVDAESGVYQVELGGVQGGLPFASRHPLAVRARDFLAEDIPLTADLTTIRTAPSGRKDEEARVYAEILGQVDPAGLWLDGSFLRPVASERRTSFFGDRRRYLYAAGGTAAAVHAGIDFAAPTGTPVKAAGRGRVVLAADREVTGKTVVLEHLPGVFTIYMHLDSLSAGPGAVLERGALLGTVGSTGLATGPHLHWELRVRGIACDPETPAFAVFPPPGP